MEIKSVLTYCFIGSYGGYGRLRQLRQFCPKFNIWLRQLRQFYLLSYEEKLILDLNQLLRVIDIRIIRNEKITISDKIGELLTGNSENMKIIAEKDAEIDKLKDKNDKLVSANGALLQKVPMGYEQKVSKEETKETPKKISLKDAFDEKGNFRK